MSDHEDAYKGTRGFEFGKRAGRAEARRSAYRADVTWAWPDDGETEITVTGPDRESGTSRYRRGRGNQRTGSIEVRFYGSPTGGGVRFAGVPYDDLAELHRQLGAVLADPRFRADAQRARVLAELDRRNLPHDVDGESG